MTYRTVLLVEDDDTLCRVIDRNLAARGISVRRASSAGEALAAVAAVRPDLLLLDIDLPDRTGWDLLRALTARTITIPTVVMTGTRVPAERLAEFKPLAYLAKPFPLEALLRVVSGEAA
ncbi:MAG TPA: response regulator [Candidatus Acidoferrales bacterium]|nr:response regulator [Candidatus Acidoferrales bacterium]